MIWLVDAKKRRKRKCVQDIDMVFSKYLVPHGGWVFFEGNVKLEEDDLDKLTLAVVAHRINNGKPLGSPSEDIEKQILERQKNVNVP